MFRIHRQVRPIVTMLLALFFAGSVAGCSRPAEQNPTPQPAPQPVTQVVAEGGTTLVLEDSVSAKAISIQLSKGLTNNDHVRWLNLTSKDLTIKWVAGSPFMGKGDIKIPAGTRSAYYTVDSAAVQVTQYPFKTSPNVVSSKDGPTDPDVGVSD